MTRNSQLITSKRGVKFESKRADDWCIYLSFSSMYDEVYKEMMVSGGGVAKKTKQAVALERRDFY